MICPKDANGMANSEDPDQTAPPISINNMVLIYQSFVTTTVIKVGEG